MTRCLCLVEFEMQ